ncbi:MAG: hypothetical protein PVH21_08025 [Myxococcales bacterium]|jgi:hypothetical protein
MQRRATSLLAAVLVLTSIAGGAALHLCGMKGLVEATCCCHEANDGPPVQLKAIDDCCGATLLQGERPSATTDQGKLHVDAPVSSLTAVATSVFAPQSATQDRAPLARGSPGEHGPPLFVWHCSYLI